MCFFMCVHHIMWPCLPFSYISALPCCCAGDIGEWNSASLTFFSCGLRCINNKQLLGVLEHSNNMIFIVVIFVSERTAHALEFCLVSLLPCPLKHQLFPQWFSLPAGVCQKEIYNFYTVSSLKCCVCSWGQAEYICALKRSRHGFKMPCVLPMYLYNVS